MQKKRMFFQIFPSYLLISAIALLAVTWYSTTVFRKFHHDEVRKNLLLGANMLQKQVGENIAKEDAHKLVDVCKRFATAGGTRVTVTETSGKVLFDSDGSAADMDNHSQRPEIFKAVSERVPGSEIRYSKTLKQNMMYLAVPVKVNEKIIATVRTSLSVSSIEDTLQTLYLRIFICGLVIAFICAFIGNVVSRRISAPIEELQKGAVKFANGDFSHRLAVSNSTEIGDVAETLNLMGDQLQKRIRKIAKQSSESRAILSSMVEGVLAVDRKEQILRINASAASLLNVEEDIKGRMIREVVRNPMLLRFIRKVMETHETLNEDFVTYGSEERFLTIQGTPLRDDNGHVFGVVVVLNDITRMRSLENMRRDFVANVSHEIRTPLAAISGAVETLQDGAMENKQDAKYFLGMLGKNSDRLSALVEDVLSLSKLDQTDSEQLNMEKMTLNPLIEESIRVCASKASKKNSSIELTGSAELEGKVNASLFEQAMINLIDNSIKYSQEGAAIKISVTKQAHQIIIAVSDNGPGIDQSHLERIFERFYRVEKSRSRKVGGTGLGLAIVKHIVSAHSGEVEVESEVGKGTTFKIILPTCL